MNNQDCNQAEVYTYIGMNKHDLKIESNHIRKGKIESKESQHRR